MAECRGLPSSTVGGKRMLRGPPRADAEFKEWLRLWEGLRLCEVFDIPLEDSASIEKQ